ncbi:hypothetical protein BOX15_Mlig029657g2 [Macrostomum lignano]|uniref:Uncharacterized protein n=1 Tax=Macrostomum lignano TaxID=282301 RepID=A0A267FFE9_9PLAT|nr:hypothetical protein BOX15_Mlig029657g4 [Macrostomum lignano]PAA52426.1 hypothetical protein BOX15_Mlig029657g3 [Macrostomum lignano]PAA72498.1 hypothetical protein BOX15_Mlig029657g1 [Macrostomum lignano]PAA93636.1 hypothetical protein BOX15_Mlig029657g2 [Macrostomum lignano]
MFNNACSADWQQQQQQQDLVSVNWKDCIHRWKRSREKWRSEALRLQKQLCDMTRSANHWRQQTGIVQAELAKARGALIGWRTEALRTRELVRQWKAEAIRWREQAREWKRRCCELMDQRDDQQIAQLCHDRYSCGYSRCGDYC